MHIRNSFTLVELLIVIVIIGILAAVAIPQFGNSSTDAKIAALDQNLACMRSAIDLYYYHHNKYPGVPATDKSGAASGGTTMIQSTHATSIEAFSKQMTSYSNANGDTSDTKSGDFPYGPYLRSAIPANPLPAPTAAATPAAISVTADTVPLSVDDKPATGWKVSSQTGQFIANNATYASR